MILKSRSTHSLSSKVEIMGNTVSNAAKEELRVYNFKIAQATETYLDFVSEMSSLVDIDLDELISSINSLLDEFKAKEVITSLGKASLSIEGDLERHANYQKHSVRLLFDFMEKANEGILDMCTKILEDEYGTEELSEDDENIANEIHTYCDGLIADFEKELRSDASFPSRLLFNRVSRFREMLVKTAYRVLGDVVTTAILNKKEIILDKIDETVRCVLKSDTPYTAEQWREVIDEIVDISDEDVAELSSFPMSNYTLVDQTCRDIQLHVRTLVRSIQLSYCSGLQGSKFTAAKSTLFENKLDVMIDEFANFDYDQLLEDDEGNDEGDEEEALVVTGMSILKGKSKKVTSSSADAHDADEEEVESPQPAKKATKTTKRKKAEAERVAEGEEEEASESGVKKNKKVKKTDKKSR